MAKRIGRLAVVAAILALWTLPLHADVVTMKDGPDLVGEILSQNDKEIVLDARLGQGRAKLTIPRGRIASIKKAPLPDGFFDEEPRPEKRRSDPAAFGAADRLYLEVPVIGQFGKDVFAAGFQNVVTYAKRYRVKHIVFVIDSTGSMDIDETRKTFHILRRSSRTLTYHAVVHNALGDAISVLMPCETIHVTPTASMGGAPVTHGKGESPQEIAQLLRARGARVAAVAEGLGRSPAILRAMVDPQASVVSWMEGKQRRDARSLPESVAPRNVVLHNKPGELLVLTPEQMTRVGVPSCDGRADRLGAALGYRSWKKESDYGRRAMAAAAKQGAADRTRREAAFAREAERLLGRREAVAEQLSQDLKAAATYDPKRDSYTGAAFGRAFQRKDYVKHAVTEYKQQAALALQHVNHALRAIAVLEPLENKAKRMGLEPLYPTGELEGTKRNLRSRRAELAKAARLRVP